MKWLEFFECVYVFVFKFVSDVLNAKKTANFFFCSLFSADDDFHSQRHFIADLSVWTKMHELR